MTPSARLANEAERRWPGQAGGSFAATVQQMHDDLRRMDPLRLAELSTRWCPDGPLTIVPLALGLATTLQSAEAAILLAANVGGDSDSVASIAGGILGGAYPQTINTDWYQTVERSNGHGLEAIARELAGLRR